MAKKKKENILNQNYNTNEENSKNEEIIENPIDDNNFLITSDNVNEDENIKKEEKPKEKILKKEEKPKEKILKKEEKPKEKTINDLSKDELRKYQRTGIFPK
jgi:hypothetical protein